MNLSMLKKTAALLLMSMMLMGLFSCESDDKSPNSMQYNFVVIDDPDFIEDTPLDPLHPDENFGAHDGGRAACKATTGFNDVFLTRLVNLQEQVPPGSIIKSCTLGLYVSRGDSLTGDKTVCVYEVFKPWVEGIGTYNYEPDSGEGCTFRTWDGARDWGIPGCHREDDDGVPNTADGGNQADCSETPMDSLIVPAKLDTPHVEVGYYEFNIDRFLVQDWVNNDECRGLVLKTTEVNSWIHLGTREAPAGQRPYYVVEYFY